MLVFCTFITFDSQCNTESQEELSTELHRRLVPQYLLRNTTTTANQVTSDCGRGGLLKCI
ncbi:hypothetical protein EG68_04315 [Paragonimus skrjabini miyazakii]|uniref:Uncharacterized protein n=1 Tax=Paragonimus skrjabini miyazakii TaxID=59628 RepID=A0A8S9YTC9_9TREM|nr:hypothetical protein EG68_04315 [Paragonimus skrjabini miyazakii]